MYMKDDNNKIIVEEDKPTKECKHERKFRDSKGKCFLCDEEWTKEKECEPNLSTILKEADKLFDNDFVYDHHIRDVWDAINIKDFLHSQIEIAYKAGRKEGFEEESGYTCPFCGRKKPSPGVICKCEVENTGMYEFWKD